MKVLLTGFDPFGGESVNPAFEAIKLLPDTIAGAEIVKVEIPTEFTRSISCVEAAIKEHNPDVVIDVGQAGGRACVTVEKVGINLADARIPDNAGEQPSDEPLQADGPDRILCNDSGQSNGSERPRTRPSVPRILHRRHLRMQLRHVQCASPVRDEISEHPRRLHPRTVRMRAGSRKSKHHGKHAAGNDCKISGILHRGSRNQQRRSKRSNGNYPLKQTFRPSYRNFGAAVCFFCYFLFCKPYLL